MTTTYVRADEVRVGDIIWETQDMVVTRVRPMSVSTAIYAQYVGKVGPQHGGAEWLLEHWRTVPVVRAATVVEVDDCSGEEGEAFNPETGTWVPVTISSGERTDR